jgi:FKBP-type peptidyl-prolyl cis-trans isomerase SlyD
MDTIQPNAFVTLDYTLSDDEGDVLDASTGGDAGDGGEPIRYVHGYGMLVPGLEAALVGLRTGEEKEVVVPAEAGFGEYDEELVLQIERSEFPDPAAVEVGDEFVAESPDGDEVPMRVVEVMDDAVVVDANHPLAGMTLHYRVRVREVRAATDDEIEQAASDFDDAQDAHDHEHGPDCNHEHEAKPELVTIGTKPRVLN